MTSVSPDPRDRRRAITEIRDTLRELSLQLALLNRQIGTRLALKDIDLDCLDLIHRHGPLTPTALAGRAHLHPATLTGILDRLERAGWITRERAPADRRAVHVRALRDRNPQLLSLYSEMNSAVETICADYTDSDLAVLTDFLTRTTTAGQSATRNLAASGEPSS
jgi:DNA-binding MarR family transcriptional regulator